MPDEKQEELKRKRQGKGLTNSRKAGEEIAADGGTEGSEGRWWQMEGSAKIRGAEAESMEGMEAEVCGLAEEG